MNYTITNWGYTVKADRIPELLCPIEFDTITAGKFMGDGRIIPNIAAAGSAIRNFCGWHIAPNLECIFSERILYGNGRIKPVGPDLLIQLPATFVTDVSSVTIGAETFTDYTIDRNGLLHVFDIPGRYWNRKTQITVIYNAGFDDDQIPGIKELMSHRVTHALASSNGVQTESAGGVSITYSANWINSARSTALANDNKEVLEPYRVQGVY